MPSFTYHHVFEPATDSTRPPLLLLHGTGGNEHDLVRLGHAISPGSALLSPRGDVSGGGALRFFARLAEGAFDPAEITRRTNALADFTREAARHYQLDPGRLLAVGLSNGANIAATMLQLRPETLRGGIWFRPMIVLEQPVAPGTLNGKQVLICSGSVDPLVPPDQPPRLAEICRRAGATVTTKVHAASHALVPADVAAAQEWLAELVEG